MELAVQNDCAGTAGPGGRAKRGPGSRQNAQRFGTVKRWRMNGGRPFRMELSESEIQALKFNPERAARPSEARLGCFSNNSASAVRRPATASNQISFNQSASFII